MKTNDPQKNQMSRIKAHITNLQKAFERFDAENFTICQVFVNKRVYVNFFKNLFLRYNLC